MPETVNKLDECQGRLDVQFCQESWDGGDGPLSRADRDELGLTLLDPSATLCENHRSRLGLYLDQERKLWLAKYNEQDKTLALVNYTAREYVEMVLGDAGVEDACKLFLGVE